MLRYLDHGKLDVEVLLRKVSAERAETHFFAARRSLLAHVVDLAERGRLRTERNSGEWRFRLEWTAHQQ